MHPPLVPDKEPNSLTPSHRIVESIAFFSPSGTHALAYLRLLGPAKQLGLGVLRGIEGGRIHPPRAAEGDVVVLQREFPADLDAYEQVMDLAHQAGKPVIFDLDDLLLELPEDHPDRQANYFARALLPILQAIIEADLVTVATPALRDYVLPYNKNTLVLPNYFNDELWRMREPAPAAGQSERLTIGYMGGASHTPDLEMIVPSLLELDDRYPGRLQFRFWGIEPPAELASRPNVDWQLTNIQSYPDFADYFQRQAADIFIGPLRDNLFNACKSPIKYFEYSALGAPGVFSRVTPYSSVISDGETGLLASSTEEWTAALSRLINEPELRLRLARNAQAGIRSKWLLSQHAPEWLEAYQNAVPNSASARAAEIPFHRLVSSLSHQISADQDNRTQTVARLSDQLTRKEQTLDSLSVELAQKEAYIRGTLEARLRRKYLEILNGILPMGTRRRQVYSRLGRAARVLIKEGLPAVWVRVRTRVAYRLSRPRTTVRLWLPPQLPGRQFVFPEIPAPRLSVVLVATGAENTRRCLAGLALHQSSHGFELVVIDDATRDNTVKLLAGTQGIQVLRNDSQQGYAACCNQAAALAHGQYLLFVRDHAVLQPGCLDELVAAAEAHPDSGLVGARLLDKQGLLWEAGCAIQPDRRLQRLGTGNAVYEPATSFLRVVDACTSVVLVSKARFEEAGCFDERLDAHAEADLALSLSRSGHLNYYQPLAFAAIFSQPTASSDEEDLFLQKWKTVKESATERRWKGRVLYIDALTPTPDQDAGSMDAFNHMRILTSLGFQVTFAPAAALEFVPRYTPDLQRIGVECLYAPYTKSIMEHLALHGGSYDLVVLARVSSAADFMHPVRQYCRRAKVIFSTVDLHYLREMRQAQLEDSAELMKQAEQTRRVEWDAMKASDCTLVVSAAEKDLLQAELPGVNVVHLPLIIDIQNRQPVPFQQRKDICFIGGFRHAPNVDAVQYFVSEVWPLVRGRIPEARFYIVGSQMTREILSLGDESVVPLGYQQDISQFFNQCRLSVAPLRFGAGLKGKVIHSLGYGLPVVVTPLAAEGSGLIDGKNVLVAEDAQKFADAIVSLYTDEVLWQRMSDNGLAFFEEKYTLAAGQRNFSTLLDSLDRRLAVQPAEPLALTGISSLSEYEAYEKKMQRTYARRLQLETALVGPKTGFTTFGLCYVCGRHVDFASDLAYALVDSAGRPTPNWRERLLCPSCGLNNRMRAAIHIFEQICTPRLSDALYLVEQTTPLFKWFERSYWNVVGSEYLGGRVPFGSADKSGTRNETLTDLTFSDRRFQHILAFDVLEHIPDYERALQECLRCLQPGGNFIFTVPFARQSHEHIVRARLSPGGEVEHLLPPEYHGDPLNAQGVLCFYHFGWNLLDQLRAVGFSSAIAYFYWSSEYGYLGQDQMIFAARKAQ